MNSKRILFLLFAVIVAGGTAMLARAWLQAERAALVAQLSGGRPAAIEAAPKTTLQVLVVKSALRVGHILKPDDLRWQPWPQGSLPAAYIVEGKRQISDFVGAVVRLPVYAGQPLVENDIVMPGSRGFLAAVLRQGMRAVSLPLTATSGVSGFIYAGDRVDVLLTHALQATEGAKEQHHATETILRNARVIAIDQKADFVPGDKPEVAKNATLELTPKQAEIITLGVRMGELSLALRSLQDEEGEGASSEDASAELGFSSTLDNQVSRLLKDPNAAAEKAPDAPKASLFVLRGSQRIRQDLEGGPFAELTPPPPGQDIDVLKPNSPQKPPTNPSSMK